MSILNLSFNQQVTHLSCCTDLGYVVYSLTPELEKKSFHQKDGGVGIMKMMNKTNISILVGGGENPFRSKNTLILYDNKNKKNIFELDLRDPIRNALIIKDTIVACLEKKVCLFEFSGKLIDTKITYANEKGLCCMSLDEDRPIIATLGTKKGELAIWIPLNDDYRTIQAHATNLDAIAINNDGTLVATASEVGTLIRIFSIATGKKKYEFRRGTFTAKVFDMCFNKNSTRLACTSSNGTVHIYELYEDEVTTKNTQSMLSGLKDYLPTYVGSQWSFKQGTVDTTAPTICGFDNEDILHVVAYDGKYFKMSGKNDIYENIYQANLHINNK